MTSRQGQEGTALIPSNLEVAEDCRAVSEVLARVGDKWTVLVVSALGEGPNPDETSMTTRTLLSGPLPPPVMGPDLVRLTVVQKLGKFLIYDNTLSNPPIRKIP